jgi:uncharacterized damage-inducible protein DinB
MALSIIGHREDEVIHSMFWRGGGIVTYYGPKQLADSFRTVRKNTLTIANEIPEDKYSYKATPDVMSVRELLAHIAVSPMWQIEVHTQKLPSLDFAYFAGRMQKLAAEQETLRSKAEVVKALTEKGEQFATFLEGLDEATLGSSISFPSNPNGPASRTRFEMLLGAKEHEMHHRGQLMLVQRLLGQVPELTRRRQAMAPQSAGAKG